MIRVVMVKELEPETKQTLTDAHAGAIEERRAIPVAEPALVGREKEFVLDCIDSTWISSTGLYIGRFEAGFAEFCGVEHAITCANGTVALHLALLALGIGPGDEVICPTLTYVAAANSVVYCGATPVLVDAEAATWNLDPAAVEAAVTPRTKAILVVHLYGHPADMDAIRRIADAHDLRVVEDAAEALGARHRGRRVGSLSDVATFSFYGNKVITTGEGGMVVTDDATLAETVRLLRGQGQDPTQRYRFPVVGYNYRLTNVACAIGCAQLEKVEWHVGRRRQIAGLVPRAARRPAWDRVLAGGGVGHELLLDEQCGAGGQDRGRTRHGHGGAPASGRRDEDVLLPDAHAPATRRRPSVSGRGRLGCRRDQPSLGRGTRLSRRRVRRRSPARERLRLS